MELLNDTLENFLKIQSEDERIISQKLSSQGSLPHHIGRWTLSFSYQSLETPVQVKLCLIARKG